MQTKPVLVDLDQVVLSAKCFPQEMESVIHFLIKSIMALIMVTAIFIHVFMECKDDDDSIDWKGSKLCSEIKMDERTEPFISTTCCPKDVKDEDHPAFVDEASLVQTIYDSCQIPVELEEDVHAPPTILSSLRHSSKNKWNNKNQPMKVVALPMVLPIHPRTR